MARSGPFQYEMLLRIRKRQEDLKAQALAISRREVQAAQDQRAQLADEQQRALFRAGELSQHQFDASEVRCYYQYERHLARLGDVKDAAIMELLGIAESRRHELEEATKRKRIVEKLKERRLRAHHKEIRRVEQRLADEAASNFAARENRFGFPDAPTGRERRTP